MKLVHEKYGTTETDSEQEARRLAQYGWSVAPEKTSRRRKPAEKQPELPIEDAPETE